MFLIRTILFCFWVTCLSLLPLVANTNSLTRQDSSILDESGVTPLMRAIRDGEKRYVKDLLKKNPDLNEKDAYGWTAIFYAVIRGEGDVVKTLIKQGANPQIKNDIGFTPLMEAAGYGHEKIVKLLIENGVDLNQLDKNGNSALGVAIRSKNNKAAELLRKAGAIEALSDLDNTKKVDSRPIPINRPRPDYSGEARNKNIQGVVRTRVLVGADGNVKKIRVLYGLPYGLTYEAVKAVSQVKFKPAMKDEQPVEYWVMMEIEFNLG